MNKMQLRVAIAILMVASALVHGHGRRHEGVSDIAVGHENSHGHSESRRARTLSPDEAMALYSSAQRDIGLSACADQFPNHQPLPLDFVDEALEPMGLCSDGFAVIYSPVAKAPLVVTEKLNRARVSAAAGEERTDNFYPDPRLRRDQRAELADFRGSGMDRGHNSPAADAWNEHTMMQTFALSNMLMQDSDMNRRPWAGVEKAVRQFARRAQGDVFVFTGPVFCEDPPTRGSSKVWVPEAMFKLVYDQASGRAWAYVLANQDDVQIQRPMDYASFVARTNLDLLAGLPVRGSIAN